VRVIRVESAREMEDAVMREFPSADIVIKAAAVADYRPVERKGEKIKKTGEGMTIALEQNPDILSRLGRERRPGQVIVGFAAETSSLRENARQKLKAKGADLIVANDVSTPDAGFSVDTNRVVIHDREGGEVVIPLASKDQVAERILDRVRELMTRST